MLIRLRFLLWAVLLLSGGVAWAVPYDVRATATNLAPVVALTQAPFALAVTLRNAGTVTLWACDLNYRIGSGPVRTTHHTFAPGQELVAQGGTQLVPSTAPWVPTTPGTYTLRCWATNLNLSNPDGNPANDTLTVQVRVVARAVSRLTLLEVFTSGSCPICGASAASVEALETRHLGSMACLHYQQDFPGAGDPYRTAETVARRRQYNVMSLPTLLLDGLVQAPAGGLGDATINARQAVASFTELDAVYRRNVATRQISVEARLTALAPITAPRVALYAAVVEPRVTPSLATNGQTALPNLVRKLLPSHHGQLLGGPVPQGGVRRLTQTWTVPATTQNCQVGNLQVVVFAQDTVTREVLQVVRARLNGVLAAPAELADAFEAGLAPNPAPGGHTALWLSLPVPAPVAVDVVDALGRTVATTTRPALAGGEHRLDLPLAGAVPGLYTVRVRAGERRWQGRLVVP